MEIEKILGTNIAPHFSQCSPLFLGYREYIHSVAVYQKYLTRLGKLSFLPTELDILDIQQHYVRVLFIF